MAKSKKNIADFQKAMLSKAQYITPDALPEPEVVIPEVPVILPLAETELGQSIDAEILEKFKLLAGETGKDYETLLRQALTHYLRLKGLRLRDALMALHNEETSIRNL